MVGKLDHPASSLTSEADTTHGSEELNPTKFVPGEYDRDSRDSRRPPSARV